MAEADEALRLTTGAAAVVYNLKNYKAVSVSECMPLLGSGEKIKAGDPIVAIVHMVAMHGDECVGPRVMWEPLANVLSYAISGKPLRVKARSDGLEFSIEPAILGKFHTAAMSKMWWKDPSARMGLFHVEEGRAQGFFASK